MDVEHHPISEALHAGLQLRRGPGCVDIGELREACLSAPGDLEKRARLLGALSSSLWRSADAVEELVWWIEHHPRELPYLAPAFSFVSHAPYWAYQPIRDAWAGVLATHGEELEIVLAAVNCFAHHEPERALALLERAHATAVHDARPARKAGQIWGLRSMRGNQERDGTEASEALRWFERALERECEPSQCSLSDACEAALAAGEPKRARVLAERLLSQAGAAATWNTGNAIYTGHSILGQVALLEGDIDRAKDHLKRAGQTPGSPQLGSFGPELDLADELLQRGERAAVVDFLRDIERFWSKRGRIGFWCHEIGRGETPRLRRFGID